MADSWRHLAEKIRKTTVALSQYGVSIPTADSILEKAVVAGYLTEAHAPSPISHPVSPDAETKAEIDKAIHELETFHHDSFLATPAQAVKHEVLNSTLTALDAKLKVQLDEKN